jgi:hypothetical protein
VCVRARACVCEREREVGREFQDASESVLKQGLL